MIWSAAKKLILMNEYFHMYHDFLEACEVRGFKPVAAKTADANFQPAVQAEDRGLLWCLILLQSISGIWTHEAILFGSG